MKKCNRIVAMLLVVLTLCSVLVIPAAAASTTAFDVLSSSGYARAYTLSTSGKTIPYTSKSLSTRGTVTYGRSSSSYIANSSDELYVMDVGCTNGQYWAYVSYPTSSRRVNAYIHLSAITGNNAGHNKTTSSGKFYCAKRLGYSNSTSYYVAKGDTVYLLATSGSKYQILYPTSGGKWRMAWCDAADYNKYCGGGGSSGNSGSGLTDVTAKFAGKTITLKSVENGKYLCADGNLSGTPAMCNRDSASTWETFTVSKLTSDGWVGFKAYNGKYLSAMADTTDTPVGAKYGNLQSWECFRIYQKGSDYYIKAQINGKWLCVRVDKSGAPVQAYAGAASTWERFRIQTVNESKDGFSPVWPCKNTTYISTMYRYWNSGNPKNHGCRTNMYNAFDLANASGDTILAIESGKVVEKGYKSGSFGHYVVIEHSNGLRSLYGHLKQEASVNVHDTVTRGQAIGSMGKTGNSTGIHLHFELYDPNDYGKVINPWVTYYQGKVAVTVGGNSYKANSRYPGDATAKAWCDWLTGSCTKSGSSYVFQP